MKRLLALGAVALAAALAACGGPSRNKFICDCTASQRCISGRCVDVPRQDETTYEPEADRATCTPPAQVYGGVSGPPAAPTPPGTCSRPIAASGLPATWTVHHDRVQVGTELTFEVPAGASGISVVLQAVDAVETVDLKVTGRIVRISNTAVPLTVTDPAGQVWFDDRLATQADGSGDLVFFASESPYVGTLTFPNTSKALEVSAASGLPAGTWKLVVSDYAYECATTTEAATVCGPSAHITPAPDFARYAAGAYDASIVVRPGPAPATGTLDLALYVFPCPGGTYTAQGECAVAPMSADGFAADESGQRMVSSLGGFLANAGLCLGTVTWYDVPDWAQVRWKSGLDIDSTTPCDFALGELLTLSAPGAHMNLFLVPTILFTSNGTPGQVVGIDGTIPGPSGFSGTVQSGAAVSGEALRDTSRCTADPSLGCGSDLVAYIAAHETGHFLGLYHTTESTGTAFDPISDTPTCACDRCVSSATASGCSLGSAVVTGNDCLRSLTSCGGGRNLMFWLLGSVSTGKISPDQSLVVRTNPLVR